MVANRRDAETQRVKRKGANADLPLRVSASLRFPPRTLSPAGLVLILAALLGAGCRAQRELLELFTISGPTMGTSFTVKVVDVPPGVDPETLRQEVLDQLRRIDSLMSTYDPDSELSRLNRSDKTDWFAVSRETAAVVNEALQVAQLTGGAFDVTVAPLVNLWNFGPARHTGDRVPAPEEIEEAKARVGWQNLEVRLSPPAVRKKRADVSLDLSGIAKGFAVDQVAELLDRRGIANYMVDVGGEVRARGHNPNGDPWRIGVESPVAGTREVYKVLALDGLAVATSGDYRNYFEKDGVRYCHILDPKSGRPVTHKLASVSVLGPSCTRADALATALVVMGPERGYNLAEQEKLAVLFIIKSDAGFVEKATPEFERVFAR
jgi:thiamine biosynthesis lipoprotein